MIGRAILGFALAVMISAAAMRTKALTESGAAASVLVGTLVITLGGWTPALLLVLFFLSGSLLSRISSLRNPEVGASFAKGGRRDARQVLANGVLPAFFSLLITAAPGLDGLAGVLGSLAAATADTWATELGVLSVRPPRRITDWRVVPAGTSGGITLLGTVASLAGALLIGAAASLLRGSIDLLPVAALSGGMGSALDSVLGATLQARYFCSSCGMHTEQHPIHAICGGQTSFSGGVRWLDNDVVNLLANASGAIIALVLLALI